MNVIEQLEREEIARLTEGKAIPDFAPGDTVVVNVNVVEGTRKGLHLPDPFAGERVFQVLTQVAGRAGRSERGGKVVLQTFNPEHQVIQSAAKHDVNGFYDYELEQRKRLGYPPFTRLVRLELRGQDQTSVEKEALKVAEQLSTINRQSSAVIGPVPCFFAKVGGYYRRQVVLRGTNPQELLRDIKLDGLRVEVDPVSLL